MSENHNPVLLRSVIDVMQPRRGESYLDLTAGYGGHAKEFLRRTQNCKDAVLIDRDDFAIEHLKREIHKDFADVQIVNQDYYSAVSSLIENGKKFDLILIDLGVSSPQLDNAGRGFSYRFDAPLDMRMDRGQEFSASVVVNDWRERDLVNIFVKYGELREGQAKMFARRIVENRPIKTTGELSQIIDGKNAFMNRHTKTQIFQAIRIAVNDELGFLEQTLPLLPDLMNSGGRLGIISFHSLEDRMIKDFMKEHSSRGLESDLRVLAKPIFGKISDPENPRARSATLRIAQKK